MNSTQVNWIDGTWKPGDKIRFYASRPESFRAVEPGLYWYSGLGSGSFFRADGTILLNCSPREGHAESARLGLEFRYVDSFGN
jgi:hypothetical protein